MKIIDHVELYTRKALTINLAKAYQPFGAVLCALGFKNTLPFVHGSQGFVAYFRSHLSRHFKEPVPAVLTSMTEDAAVFGGLNNLIEGLENAYALYKPKMFAISTTCMAEVIGDDLNASIKKAKQQGVIPPDIPTPYANTANFTGSHLNGYDAMFKGILSYMTSGLKPSQTDKSCAFDGAMIVLNPIVDTTHLVHGPITCFANSWNTRGTFSNQGIFHKMGFTMHINELDFIFGTEEKLYSAILETYVKTKPSAIFVYATCLSGLIGCDIEGVCRKAEKNYWCKGGSSQCTWICWSKKSW